MNEECFSYEAGQWSGFNELGGNFNEENSFRWIIFEMEIRHMVGFWLK